MAETTIVGVTLDGPKERDAIHVAVAPVIASERLYPGQHIGLKTDGDHETVTAKAIHIGIVDPFLPRYVEPGERFWMFLYQQSITSLKHNWTHPAFGGDATQPRAMATNPAQAAISQQWIQDFAETYDLTYNRMIEAAKDWIEHGEWLCDGGKFEGERVPEEFWEHYERVTGATVDEDKKENFFTCSC